MQGDTTERLGLRQLLLEPEMLRTVQPDISLVSTLMGLSRVIPEHSKETARAVVRAVTDDLQPRLRAATVQAVTGGLDRSVRTRLVAFDTAVVDLSEELEDPVDVVFGVQLGGGTDINGALAYCQGLIRQPQDTIVVLISDLFEGGIADEMVRRCRSIVDSGATMIALLALSDDGAPSYDADHAAALAALGIPSFACTPDLFPDLMAAAIERRYLGQWAAANDIVTAG